MQPAYEGKKDMAVDKVFSKTETLREKLSRGD